MKFPHMVKYNGVYYPIGADVPIEENGGGMNTPAEPSGKVDKVKEDKKIVKEEPKEADKTRKYSEQDLDVPYFSLKALAKNEGLKIPDKAKSSEIKNMLRAL